MDATDCFCGGRNCNEECVARVSNGTTKNMDEHESGWPAATCVSAYTSKVSNTIVLNNCNRFDRWHTYSFYGYNICSRFYQHRNTLRICTGVRWRFTYST